ncbi:restriction endonuclease subunit S [Pseudomonas sp. C9-3]|uniref:restriction endonuclease subunit S n=1 Tax=Pseudomonas sp. C9-3 TaxID=3078264 RepID=UPI0028E4B982|nr:restriction endonuclease subunit S [Pseudomonas sp. C9-3]
MSKVLSPTEVATTLPSVATKALCAITVPLCEVAEIRTGIAKGKAGLRAPVELPYLRVANVQDGRIDLASIKNILVESNSIERYALQAGDVLMTEGGDIDKLGRGAVWNGQIEPCLHQNHVFAVRPDKRLLNSTYLAAVASSDYGRKYFLSCAKRTTNLASINSSQLKAFPIPLPPLPEQNRIASVLTAVDEKLDVIARQIEATQTLKQGLMQTLFSRGVGKQDANSRWIPHTEFKDSELGAIPTVWSVKEIGEVLSVVERPIKMADDQLYRRVTVKRRYGGVELRDELPGANIKVKNQFLLEAGDFLISERQIVHGACGIVPEHLAGALVSNEYLVLQAKEGFDVTYFNYLVQLLKYAKLFLVCSQGVDIEKFLFKPKDWLKKRIPVPPLAEQQRIAEILGASEEKTNALQRKQSEYQNLKRGLMQKLLTGEWRVKLDSPIGTV